VTTLAAGPIDPLGLHNVRDLGGLPVAGGGAVRRGVLFRGAGLHHLDAAGAAALAGLGLRSVFDLRTAGELKRFGGFAAAGDRPAVAAHVPMLPRAWQVGDESGEAVEMLGRRYASMLESGRDAVRAVVERLGQPEAVPAMFFCAAGKDRTGVMAAVLLGLVGVPDDEIVADYALSEAGMPGLMRWYEANQPGTAEWIAGLPSALLEAPAGAMESLLATLRERHDSIAGYVSWCGVPQSSIAATRAALVG
jgi:protein-tyrosine phosphatase